MKITESLKEYLTVELSEWNTNQDNIHRTHILDWSNGVSEDPSYGFSIINHADLELLKHWADKNNRFPIIGRLTTVDSNGEYEWSFSSERHAKEGMHNLIVDANGNVNELSDDVECPYTYLFGNDLTTVKKALLKILFHRCGVGVVDETELCGWLYIVDLSNAKSYYGSTETIFPPNFADGQKDSECRNGPEDMDFYIKNESATLHQGIIKSKYF